MIIINYKRHFIENKNNWFFKIISIVSKENNNNNNYVSNFCIIFNLYIILVRYAGVYNRSMVISTNLTVCFVELFVHSGVISR